MKKFIDESWLVLLMGICFAILLAFTQTSLQGRIDENRVRALNEAIAGMKKLGVEETRPVDALLMDAAKTLLSTFYTYAGRYDQDPAYTLLHIPGLQAVKTLAALEPGSNEAGFMAITVLREMNRVNHLLDDAACTLDRALRLISG